MDEAHQVHLVEEFPARSARSETEVLSSSGRARAIRFPVRVSADKRELVECGREDAGDGEVGPESDGGGRFGQAIVEVQAVDLPVEPQVVLRARDAGLGASGVPLREGLRPVGLDVLDDARAQGFALILDGELECAVDEDRRVWVEAFVSQASAQSTHGHWTLARMQWG